MTDALERWLKTKRCICPRPDRRTCFQVRFGIRESPDDPWDLIDDECSCACHDEYDEDAEAAA